MKHRAVWAGVAWAAATLSGAAQAQVPVQAAFTATAMHLRAGPAADYPVVAVLPAGFQIAVQGCLPDYSWCDVYAGPQRGWLYAAYINYPYQNTYVPVLTYGAVIGIGVLAFVLNDYWPHYYRDRPWYRERHQWEGRPAPQPRYPTPYPSEHPPRPSLPTPPGFVGPGGQLNPPPQHGAPGQATPGRAQGQAGQRQDRHERQERQERRDDRHGDR